MRTSKDLTRHPNDCALALEKSFYAFMFFYGFVLFARFAFISIYL